MPENVNILARTLGQLETDTLRKLWINLTDDDLLSDGSPAPAVFYQRYTKTQVDDAINQAYSNIVVSSKYRRSWLLIRMRQGFGQYPLPLQVAGVDEAFYFSSATSYEKLEIYNRADLEGVSPGWIIATGNPSYAYPGDPIGIYQSIGVTPRPSIDGTAVTLASGVAASVSGFGPVEGVEGVAGLGSTSSTYVDSQGQNFADLGVIVGQTLVNRSDGSRGTITSVATTNTSNDTLICLGGFSGGALNSWSPADEMQITGGSYFPVTVLTDFSNQYYLSPSLGHFPLPGVTMAAGNLLCNCYLYPMLLREQNQYPELTPNYHQAIPFGAAALLFSEQPAGSPEAAKAEEYSQLFNQKVAEAAVSRNITVKLRLIGDSRRSRRWP